MSDNLRQRFLVFQECREKRGVLHRIGMNLPDCVEGVQGNVGLDFFYRLVALLVVKQQRVYAMAVVLGEQVLGEPLHPYCILLELAGHVRQLPPMTGVDSHAAGQSRVEVGAAAVWRQGRGRLGAVRG